LAAGDLFPRRLVWLERSRLVRVGDLDGLADLQRAAVGLLGSVDHPEQRRLACAVRPDDADDAAAGERKAQSLEQQLVAEGLLEILRVDNVVAKSGGRRDDDFMRRRALERVLRGELLVLLHAGLVLGLTRAGRHAHP